MSILSDKWLSKHWPGGTNAADQNMQDSLANAGAIYDQYTAAQDQLRRIQAQQIAPQPRVSQWHSEDEVKCLRQRMRDTLTHGHLLLVATARNDKEVALFLQVRGEPMIVKDDADMFPSDALVLKLRMLGES
jgi:hypothetical protein